MNTVSEATAPIAASERSVPWRRHRHRLILLTGDRAAAAREVGETLRVDEVVADVLPAQQLEVVRRAGRRAYGDDGRGRRQ